MVWTNLDGQTHRRHKLTPTYTEYASISFKLHLHSLNNYHTIPHFDALKIYSCGKHCEKRRNCLQQAISTFLTMFSTLYGTYFSF